MSPGDRCDAVIRLIDQALSSDVPISDPPTPTDVREAADEAIEAPPGHWGVYYLKPSA